MSLRTLKGKVVLITGASSGIGEALALASAGRGARLALFGRDAKRLASVQQRCLAVGAPAAFFYALDLTRASALKPALKRVRAQLGPVDLLVNNAGQHALGPVAQVPERMARRAMDINYFSVLRLTQLVLPDLRKTRGAILNIGSTLGYRGVPGTGVYAATKGALLRLTESLRDELAAEGIRVMLASPGVVLTRLRARAPSAGPPPTEQAQLPYPRSAELTAQEILRAFEAGDRELISAAWPVRFWARVLVPFFPSLLDRLTRR